MKKMYIYFCFIFSTHALNVLAINGICELEETPEGFYDTYCQTSTHAYGGGARTQYLPSHGVLDMTPVKNQNPLGTCASFATSACVEYHHQDKKFLGSEAEFTVLAETQIAGEDCKAGLHLGQALYTAQTWGMIEQKRLPYSPYVNYVQQKNDQDLKDPYICVPRNYNQTMQDIGVNLALKGTDIDRTPYKVGTLNVLHHSSQLSLNEASLSPIKRAIFSGHPVAVSLPVFKGSWDTHQIKMPSSLNTKIEGYHAVVINEYDDTQKVFYAKNSWGESWGNHGYASIPYEYVQKFSNELVEVKKPN